MTFVTADAATIVAQVGRMNVLAISGGRVIRRETGVTLMASSGYRVTIDLAGNDTYTVSRVFVRAGKTHDHGTVTDVHCEELGETAWQASCFRSYDFPRGSE